MPGQLDSFKSERQRAGITSAAVAAKLGISEQHLLDMEAGGVPITADFAARYRRAVIELGGKFGQPNPNEFN